MQARNGVAGFNSLSRGFSAGGSPPARNQIDGIQFSNEAAIDPAAALGFSVDEASGINSTTKGYVGGGIGITPEGNGYPVGGANAIQGFLFSNETTAITSATLAQRRFQMSGVMSVSRGYFGGGNMGPAFPVRNLDQIDGIQFSNETAINPAAALVQARISMGGVNSTTKGYFLSGNISGVGRTNQIDGIQYSNEAAIDPAAVLTQTRDGGGSNNSSSRGYYGGGGAPTVPLITNQIDGIQFSNEAAIDPAASLAQARYDLFGGFQNSQN